MITLKEIKDWLKTLEVAEHYYIGRLDSKKEKSLGVYNRTRSGAPVTAIDTSSYDIKGITLLIHWTKDADETEIAAQNLWSQLQRITNLDIGEKHIYFIALQVPEPISVNYDDDGIYEYVIDLDIYYRR